MQTKLTPCFWALPGMALAAAILAGCSNRPGEHDFVGEMFKPLFPPSPSQVAGEAFNVYDADKRREAVDLLASAKWGGEEAYVKLYRMMLGYNAKLSAYDAALLDPDATVRAACVRALSTHGNAGDAELFVRRLDDESATVRWEAAKALQRVHNPTAVTPLIGAMGKDEDADVRMAAAYALGQYPQPAVFSALVAALDDRDFAVVETARQSLRTLTGADLGNDGSEWMSWAKANPGEKMFKGRQEYVWQPYVMPRSFWQKTQFWKKYAPPQPQAPKGMS